MSPPRYIVWILDTKAEGWEASEPVSLEEAEAKVAAIRREWPSSVAVYLPAHHQLRRKAAKA